MRAALPDAPAVCLVTDSQRAGGVPQMVEQAAAEARRGDVNMVILREPHLSAAERMRAARGLSGALPAGVLLVVHSDIAAARAAGAAGVHWPWAAEPQSAPDLLHGRSVHSEAEVLEALGAEPLPGYLLLGNVHPTESHPGRPALPEAEVAACLAAAGGVPVLAIGGARRAALPLLLERGFRGMAYRMPPRG